MVDIAAVVVIVSVTVVVIIVLDIVVILVVDIILLLFQSTGLYPIWREGREGRERETDRQTDRQRETDRQTERENLTCGNSKAPSR